MPLTAAQAKQRFDDQKKKAGGTGRAALSFEVKKDGTNKKISFGGLNYNKQDYFDVTSNHGLGDDVWVGNAGSSNPITTNSDIFFQFGGGGVNGDFARKLSDYNLLDEANESLELGLEFQLLSLNKERKDCSADDVVGRVVAVDVEEIWENKKASQAFPADLPKKIIYTVSPNLANLAKGDDEAARQMVDFGRKLYSGLKEEGVKQFVWPLFSGEIYRGKQDPKNIAKWQIAGFMQALVQDQNKTDFEGIEVFFAHRELENAFFEMIEYQNIDDLEEFVSFPKFVDDSGALSDKRQVLTSKVKNKNAEEKTINLQIESLPNNVPQAGKKPAKPNKISISDDSEEGTKLDDQSTKEGAEARLKKFTGVKVVSEKEERATRLYFPCAVGIEFKEFSCNDLISIAASTKGLLKELSGENDEEENKSYHNEAVKKLSESLNQIENEKVREAVKILICKSKDEIEGQQGFKFESLHFESDKGLVLTFGVESGKTYDERKVFDFIQQEIPIEKTVKSTTESEEEKLEQQKLEEEKKKTELRLKKLEEDCGKSSEYGFMSHWTGKDLWKIELDDQKKDAKLLDLKLSYKPEPIPTFPEQSRAIITIKTLRYSPNVEDRNSVFNPRYGQFSELRGNKFKIVQNSVYGDQGKIESILGLILVKAALSGGENGQQLLNFEELGEVIALAKRQGGISHKFNPTTGQYEKIDISSFDAAKKEKYERFQKFSEIFQKECEELGILSGRKDSTRGLRLAFLPETVANGLEEEREFFVEQLSSKNPKSEKKSVQNLMQNAAGKKDFFNGSLNEVRDAIGQEKKKLYELRPSATPKLVTHKNFPKTNLTKQTWKKEAAAKKNLYPGNIVTF